MQAVPKIYGEVSFLLTLTLVGLICFEMCSLTDGDLQRLQSVEDVADNWLEEGMAMKVSTSEVMTQSAI